MGFFSEVDLTMNEDGGINIKTESVETMETTSDNAAADIEEDLKLTNETDGETTSAAIDETAEKVEPAKLNICDKIGKNISQGRSDLLIVFVCP